MIILCSLSIRRAAPALRRASTASPCVTTPRGGPEEGRPIHLADIVIESAYSHQGAVGLNFFGRLFSQICDHDAVVIGSRRPTEQFLEQGVI
jgi:hypothetical protein